MAQLTMYQKQEIDRTIYVYLYAEFMNYINEHLTEHSYGVAFPELATIYQTRDIWKHAYDACSHPLVKQQPLSQLEIHCNNTLSQAYHDVASMWYSNAKNARYAE